MNDIIALNEKALVKQSRSFSIPILNLEPRLKLPIMVEYNLNKLMDTIEDNPALSIQAKHDFINQFLESVQEEKVFNVRKLLNVTPKEESYVLEHSEAIFKLYFSLPEEMKHYAKKYNQEMGQGMQYYLQHPIKNMNDLEHYCYYVAGTVGLYLTDVTQSYYPFEYNLIEVKDNARHYGLFLQKLNIVRDFHEDNFEKQRSFWPQELLEQYSKEDCLKIIASTIIEKDIPCALRYYQMLPKAAQSYIQFNRFIILSSLEYLKLILKRKSVFSATKLKLSKVFIGSLFEKMVKISEALFQEKCQELLVDCKLLNT